MKSETNTFILKNSYLTSTAGNYQVGGLAAVTSGGTYGRATNGAIWFDSCVVANNYMYNSSTSHDRTGVIIGASSDMTYVENWLQSNPDMKVIMSIGDGGGIGANQAVKAAGKAEGFGIFAVDGTIEALQLMVNGDPIKGEVAFSAGWQLGHLMIDTCYTALTEEEFNNDNVTPNQVVTLDTLEDWIKDWGYEDRIDLTNLANLK